MGKNKPLQRSRPPDQPESMDAAPFSSKRHRNPSTSSNTSSDSGPTTSKSTAKKKASTSASPSTTDASVSAEGQPQRPVSSKSALAGSFQAQGERQSPGTSTAAATTAALTAPNPSSTCPPKAGAADPAGSPGKDPSPGATRSRKPVLVSRSRSLSPGLLPRLCVFPAAPSGQSQSPSSQTASLRSPADTQSPGNDCPSVPGETPALDEGGFTVVCAKKSRGGQGKSQPRHEGSSHSPSTSAAPTDMSENTSHLGNRPSAAPRRPLPSVSVARAPPPTPALPAFRIPPQEGYQTSYDAVAKLESLHPSLNMRNLVGKDNSCVVVPQNEATYNHLCALAEDDSFPVRLVPLEPGVNTTKGVVMGYPLRMPTDLLLRHPQVEEATRCSTPRYREETRQVIVSVRGPLPPHLDLGNWGVYYLRPYSPEPLRCFRCQRFGHHRANCNKPYVCGMCSGPHATEGCLDKYKARQEVQPRCPNCFQAHHAWNRNCPARLRRVHQGRANQVTWVTEQQANTSRPAPPGTFVWGQQRNQTPAAPPVSNPTEFPPLLPDTQSATAQSPATPQPTALTKPDQPTSPTPLSLPPGTLLMTKSLLTDFAKELALAVASTFQKLAGVKMDTRALESTIGKIADRAIDQMIVKARAVPEAQQHNPASTLTAPPCPPRRHCLHTGPRCFQLQISESVL